MGKQRYENKEVVSAINAVTAYHNILLKMAKTEKDFANRHSLMFMMELNKRLIALLNEFKEKTEGLKALPDSLKITPENLISRLPVLSQKDANLLSFVKSQSFRWHNLLDALASIPLEMLEPFAIVAVVGGAEWTFLASTILSLEALLMPELVMLDLAILGQLAVGILVVAAVVALVIALDKTYDKIKPSYASDNFASISNDQLSALNSFVDVTNQVIFETTLEDVELGEMKFEKVDLTRTVRDARQLFFKPQSSSIHSLADEAATRYDTVSSMMGM